MLLCQSVLAPLTAHFRGANAVPQVVVNTKATCSFDTDATYVIAGGLGGLGRSIARWMASRGARNMILLSRSGAKSKIAKTLIKDLRLAGVNVEAPVCDIAQYDVLKHVIDECLQKMPAIKGCVQSTMVLRVCYPRRSFGPLCMC